MALSYGSLLGSKEFDTSNCVVEGGVMRLGEKAIAAPENRRKDVTTQGFMLFTTKSIGSENAKDPKSDDG
jgi:hypothetical protein